MPSIIIIFTYLKNRDLIDSLKVLFRVCHVNANLFMKAKVLILCQIQYEQEVCMTLYNTAIGLHLLFANF